jgi:hypothetical protein
MRRHVAGDAAPDLRDPVKSGLLGRQLAVAGEDQRDDLGHRPLLL